ncbi:MAG: ribose 5-phosphate isomerase B [Candidatus Marinimicrobia bacterium]|nr:ribose 5-phosphate isomerase B [Candidatus Neomarinimicrobiota bacterium]
MKIAIGADHAGYSAKKEVICFLEGNGYSVTDVGAFSEESVDYPDIALKVADMVASHKDDRGILFCGTGIGVSITANKTPGIRAALCSSIVLAKLSRRHNDANILAIGARFHTVKEMISIIKVWLETPFDGGRHTNRINKIEKLT